MSPPKVNYCRACNQPDSTLHADFVAEAVDNIATEAAEKAKAAEDAKEGKRLHL